MDEIENDDIIDKALSGLLSTGEGEESLAAIELEVVSTLINGLIDDEVIPDIPDYEDEDSVKQEWLDKYFPIIKEKLKEIEKEDV